MKVNEIFLSIQGESLLTGFPTVFVRFTGCNLRCSFCDTKYSYTEGNEMTLEEILDTIKGYGYKRVCLTGGEPLLQKDIWTLLGMLYDYRVTIETNGSIKLRENLLKNHSYVMDMKPPSSGCSNDMVFDNFYILNDTDEIKYVIGDVNDYNWSKEVISKYHNKGIITFSPAYNSLKYETLVEWILRDRLDVRFQLQLHKIIWGQDTRGV